MVCGLQAAHVMRADSCRTPGRSHAATVPVAARSPPPRARATRIPRRLRLASRPGAGRVGCVGPVPCSHRTWFARIPGEWSVWSHTGSQHAGCQKQPCTKHTALNRRNTRSGLPGSLRSCRRYRSPRAWMARRSASSGRVSLLPIPAIMRERVARSTMSAIVVPARIQEERRRQQVTREVPDVMQLDGMRRRCAGPDWSVSPRCGDGPIEGGTAGSPGGFGAVSPSECHP